MYYPYIFGIFNSGTAVSFHCIIFILILKNRDNNLTHSFKLDQAVICNILSKNFLND